MLPDIPDVLSMLGLESSLLLRHLLWAGLSDLWAGFLILRPKVQVLERRQPPQEKEEPHGGCQVKGPKVAKS